MKQIKLEVGKTYRSREGEEVKIKGFAEGLQYPYRGNRSKWYAESGQWCNKKSPYDLIEEAPSESCHTFAIPDGGKEGTVSQEGNAVLPHVSGSALIADFMGVQEKESTFDSYGRQEPFWYSGYLGYRTPAFSVSGKSLDHLLNENKFLHSWDWLLPVYRKIRDIINDRAKLDKHTRTKGDLLELDAQMAICAVDIQKAFDSIVAFIKWYNTSLADR